MKKLSIRDLNLKGKRVFIRVDFNVPLNHESQIKNDTRIQASLPTIRHAIACQGRLVLASHLGRPNGKVNPKMSLRPVAEVLRKALNCRVRMASDCVGEAVKAASYNLRDGEVLLLENLRFHPQEETNDNVFSKQLAELCDCYVNDAFGSAHRAHASTVGMVEIVGNPAAGFLMEKELAYLGKAISAPDRPYVAILGGAKVSGKIEVIKNLMKIVDVLLIGGGMAYTFLKAQGLETGKSLVEREKIVLAGDLLRWAHERNLELILPSDHFIADRLDPKAQSQFVPVDQIPLNWMGVDIGPRTITQFEAKIATAKTVLWNGPLGVFEIQPFSKGSLCIARAVAKSTATSIVGGGDSIAVVTQAGVTDKISHLSTGGGASLEFLGGLRLPGIEALNNK